MPTTTDGIAGSISIQAILLVTRTRAGPRILLHYPPTPGDSEDAPPQSSVVEGSSSQSDSQAINAQVKSHATGNVLPDRSQTARRPSTTPSTTTTSTTTILAPRPSTASLTSHHNLPFPFPESSQTPSPETQQSWTNILGFPADSLARMLAPAGRSWHKTRLELRLGELCFLGCPVYERKEGGWMKERGRGEKGRQERKEVEQEGKEVGGNDVDDAAASHDVAEEQGRPTAQSPMFSATQIPNTSTTIDPITSNPLTSFTTTSSSLPSSGNSGPNGLEGLSTTTKDTLHLFNVVFVLSCSSASQLLPGSSTSAERPTSVDSLQRERLAELYTHCVKKLARALQVRQKKGNYVWEEVRNIMGVRTKAREAGASYAMTWPHLHSNSSLARALAITFTGLNQSSIAHLNLGAGYSLSLQLPQQTSTQQISTPTDPNFQATPGLWLTTFDAPTPDDQNLDASASRVISPSSALLLLVPAETLLKEIAAAPKSSLAVPLSYYIRSTLPTKTLQQLSQKSRLSLPNMQQLATHLIHWRRARALPPLHHTNTYITSPLADWAKLEQASSAFRARFPALPSLPSILARLSCPAVGATGPQSWGRLMPSPDHKEAYMQMLEWLVREAWVTQLRTFAWVVITREVKAEVARKVRVEEREAARVTSSVSAAEEAVDTETDEQSVVAPSKASTGVGRRRQSSQGSTSLLSPRLTARVTVARRTSEAASISSVSTAVRLPRRSSGKPGEALSPAPPLARGRNSHTHRVSNDSTLSSRPPEVSMAGMSSEPEIQPADFKDSIVTDPHKANALESRWLEHVGEMQDAEVREAWPRLLRYFDGKHAIEEIATREGMKRKVVSPILARLLGGGEDGAKGVLRTVRHW